MLDLTKTDAAAIYEGLELLKFFLAKARKPERYPYNEASITGIQDRLTELHPDLADTYRGPTDGRT